MLPVCGIFLFHIFLEINLSLFEDLFQLGGLLLVPEILDITIFILRKQRGIAMSLENGGEFGKQPHYGTEAGQSCPSVYRYSWIFLDIPRHF